MTTSKETERNGIDDSIKRKLQDSHWQEGLTWRKKMIQIIAKLRRDARAHFFVKEMDLILRTVEQDYV
jgi:hypothetical protein